MDKIKVGQKVKFDPFKGLNQYGFGRIREKVRGVVIKVHKERRWFEVEYDLGDQKHRTAFNFDDIGDAVKVCE